MIVLLQDPLTTRITIDGGFVYENRNNFAPTQQLKGMGTDNNFFQSGPLFVAGSDQFTFLRLGDFHDLGYGVTDLNMNFTFNPCLGDGLLPVFKTNYRLFS